MLNEAGLESTIIYAVCCNLVIPQVQIIFYDLRKSCSTWQLFYASYERPVSQNEDEIWT